MGAAAEIGGEGSGVVSIARAFFGPLAQKGIYGFAGRNGVSGELVAEIGERELEAIGKLAGVSDRLRKIGEQARHFLGAFQVPLGVDGQQAAGFLNFHFVADAGEDIERFAGMWSGVADAVGGDERQMMMTREIHESLVVRFFVAVVMPLQFDIESSRKRAGDVGSMPSVRLRGFAFFFARMAARTLSGVNGDS